jgi:hypothetical protein
VSTAYYAVYDALARDCADLLIGTGQARGRDEWTQVYRALEHGFAKDACLRAQNLPFPPQIVDFARTFAMLQEERHKADYDPNARYTRAETLHLIAEAETVIRKLRSARKADWRAFAVLVLLRRQ